MKWKNFDPSKRKNSSLRSGMTLIELLTVVSIIAVLLSILVPAINTARISVLNKQGSMQFQRFIHALRDYYSEYQSYPPFIPLTENEAAVFNLAAGDNGQNFIRALTGKEPGGAPLTDEHLALNPKRVVFLETSAEDFFREENTGDRDESHLADIFNNKDIFILLENPTDENRRIPKNIFPS
ncbi:MAG: type II secretion system GspH family protein, partial [Puniceicoccales bacterium]|nr:type II secretion system GspH family protein [Puniceicoccales bacterium]